MKLILGSEIESFIMQFRDYIRSKYDIELEIRKCFDDNSQTEMFGLFVDENEPLFDRIQQEKMEFLQDPFHPRYSEASWQSGDVKEKSYNMESIFSPFIPKLSYVKQIKFTFFVTALCVCIYLFQLIGIEEEILILFHFPADTSQRGDIWRYLTHTLVHLSPWHILFNLTWWWIFGSAIERQLGIGKIVSIYIIAGIMSGIIQNYFSGYAFFGLSGVVYAVLGYVFIVNKFTPNNQFDVPNGFLIMLIVGIILGFISPLIGINMGNAAHITGLVTGLILGAVHCKFKVC
ncbi:GlpG protein [Bisgaardia hudsonensis]|uniref:GlpG protein n=1 Tax=Bisgaardia hudsonensis TaxID=109472 RepID=A0A4R2N006_9PAST|nr:rhomboid family intramembrane serine protease [Bisgaardia hudsonensis]QLB12326.1 hypothetical protein A6A11_01200 [Bisgaardia hudsonensis]TCP12373.1 GlpG protein [Bisgaardia hudsonensis]